MAATVHVGSTGPDKDTIAEARAAIINIMTASAGDAVKTAALDALVKLSVPPPPQQISLSNFTFNGSSLADEPQED